MAENTTTVFATSGFVIPLTGYHTPYVETQGLQETLFARAFKSTSDQITREFFKNSGIYISDTAKRLYDDYLAAPSYDKYIAIVDMTTDILKNTTPKEFFRWQVGCKHISSISLMFCKDVITGKFQKNYNSYNVLSASARFMINNNTTSEKANALWLEFDRDLKSSPYQGNSWVHLLTPLMGDKAAFLTFFKHIFVDYY